MEEAQPQPQGRTSAAGAGQQQQQHRNNNPNRRSLVMPNNKKTNNTSSASFRLRSPSLNSLRLRRIFDIFDKNGDGIITVEEISRALNLLGLDVDLTELHSIVSSFIRPGNLGLCYHDFEALHLSLDDSFFCTSSSDDNNNNNKSNSKSMSMSEEQQQEDSDLSEAFKVFDEDGDGYISAKELQVVLTKLGLPEAREMERIRQMILSVDTNHDGRVDFFEFKNMMRRSSSALLVPSS